MFQLIARHLLHTLNIIVVESFTTPHHYCPMSVQPLPALTVTKYGTERMNEEDGMFTDRGYIAYKGYISMEEVMNGGQSNHMVMRGMM